MNQQNNDFLDLKVNLSESETIKCPGCQGLLFKQSFVLKKIPKMIIGAPSDVPVPVPVYRCDDCGEVLKEFIPAVVGGAALLKNDGGE